MTTTVLRPPPRQQQRTQAHRPDNELDRLITNHRRRHAHRFAMLGVDHRGLLGRHLATITNTRRI